MLWLASASPRRAALLQQLGVSFRVIPEIAVDETRQAQELPFTYVTRLARLKAAAGQARLAPTVGWVLGADTCVVKDGCVLGKPADRTAARAMLDLLAGTTHHVLTGVCLLRGEECHAQTVATEVTFARLTAMQVEAYLRTGEWQDKAGGYAIQGFAAAFVAHIEGSHSNVVGLPLHETALLLHEAGIAYWQEQET